MSRSQTSLVNTIYRDWEAERNWFDKLDGWKQRRYRRLACEFYGALCAHSRSGDGPENSPSVPTCERSPTPEQTAERDAERWEQEISLSPYEADLVPILLQMGIEDIDRAARIAEGNLGDGHKAVHAALGRDKERQWKVLALLERGDTAHALRLATCCRRSVQLTCPEHAGGCGCTENYVPTHCDSPLCSDCQQRKTGQNVGKYRDAVFEMDQPVLWTLTTQNVEDPVAGREEIVEALGKLRRRTIPTEGSVTREAADGDGTITQSWSWWEGTDVDDIEKNHTQWKVKLQENGQHDLVRRLQREYVNYEYETITGTHVGKNIPMDELVAGGLYGIDVKQKGAMEWNVHAHVLVDAAYIPQAALSAVWEDITGDPVVDVRRIYDRGTEQSIDDALQETVGYAVKPPEFDDLEDEVEYVEAAKGCPDVHPFGSLHGAGDPDAGALRCAECEQTPYEWEYNGMVSEAIDNMGKNWETDRGKDPPE